VRFVGFEVVAKVTMSVRILSVIDAGIVLVAHLLLRCHLEDQFHSKFFFLLSTAQGVMDEVGVQSLCLWSLASPVTGNVDLGSISLFFWLFGRLGSSFDNISGRERELNLSGRG
jgi:hypothetical protein